MDRRQAGRQKCQAGRTGTQEGQGIRRVPACRKGQAVWRKQIDRKAEEDRQAGEERQIVEER